MKTHGSRDKISTMGHYYGSITPRSRGRENTIPDPSPAILHLRPHTITVFTRFSRCGAAAYWRGVGSSGETRCTSPGGIFVRDIMADRGRRMHSRLGVSCRTADSSHSGSLIDGGRMSRRDVDARRQWRRVVASVTGLLRRVSFGLGTLLG